ncbi:MAG TPA: hypothetical protein VMH04_22250 [Candidatus Solibacter sp.]|nr:hypothetical protein [Candidatus Solibacter sp.]
MNRVGITLVAILLLAVVCVGQGASAPAQAASAKTVHGAFPVKVTKTLDSSKLKDDDTVELETVGSFKLPDGTLVSKGSKLEGRVVSAKARSKGDADSALTLTFDKLNLQGGKQLKLKGSVQAIFPPAEEAMGPNMATTGTSQGGSGAGGSSAGVGISNAKSGSNMESSSSSQMMIDTKATGVQGMHDLQLENGVITSKGKNVKLGGGVRVIVQVEISG